MADDLRIGGHRIERGTSTTLELPLPPLYTHDALTLTVHVRRGRRAGPTLLVTSALHGDEINGVEIVRRLLGRRALERLAGTLVCVPVVNVFGLLRRERYLPDGRDLNRSFPGSASGSLAARIAHLVMRELVAPADFGIDLHTGARHRTNLPQARVAVDAPGALALAQDFGAPVILDAGLRTGSLRAAAAELDTPVMVYEAGEALRHDEVSIRAGVAGILNVMSGLGMIRRRRAHGVRSVQARASRWVRAPASGVFRARSRLGARVKKGEKLGEIGDPLGENAVVIESPTAGIVIGELSLPLVFEGEALYHIGSFEELASAETQIDALQQLYDPEML